ncbi:acid-sensing ion channel 4-A isoform X1 [Parasteatoda tepidariorum]|uniref:acid-sensing ion channel 4-A isoform X1 n=3 Tax=Parasteatoda tepidariorum TaxID=114398 RepID=UPI0039BCE80F
MYLEYPSFVELNVEQPQDVMFPAFTICNLNEIRIGPYCEKFPHKCSNIRRHPKLCTLYPEYCRLVGNKSKLLPMHPVSDYNLTRTERQEFGHQFQNLLVGCTIETDGKEEECKSEHIPIQALSHSHITPFNCFVMYSLYGQPNATPRYIPVSTVIRIILNIEVDEYHPEHLSRGAQISIHSPYHVPSPMSDGRILNLGGIYRFYLSMTSLEMLPPPYKSMCRDYMGEWTRNGGKGPITQKMCKEKCKLDHSLNDYGCADARIDYPHNETICEKVIANFHVKTMPICAKKCSMPCKFNKFQFQVQDSNSEGFRNSCIVPKDLTCYTLVQIFLENMEITTFKYTPRFNPVGILSWIGGYVGLWLGISLLQVYDFLEKGIFICIAFLRKKKNIVETKLPYDSQQILVNI